MMMNLVLYMN